MTDTAPGSGIQDTEDALKELEELAATPPSTVQNAIPDSDSLDALDALLEESTAIADAKRLQKQGRKLTLEQQAILEANKLAAEAARWESHMVYAHFAHVYCECGAFHEQFRGWYKYQELQHGNGRRLVKVPDHEDIPAMRYTTEENVQWCQDCVGELPEADIELNDMLSTLGEQTAIAEADVPTMDDEPSDTPVLEGSVADAEHEAHVDEGADLEQ